jgi:pimeloyl-ACP methyl ester carboxylesterase
VRTRRIVATHGLGDSAATWAPLVAYLAGEGIDVETWDLAGHGEADPPAADEPYGVDAAAAALETLVTSGPVPVVLLGHSFGGYLSLRYALAHPDQVAGLVLVATGPGYRSAEKRAEWNEYLARAAGKMEIAPGVEEMARQDDSVVIDGLAEIAVPVVVLTGELDTRFHAGGDHIASRVPAGRHDLVAAAGHHPHVDAPDEVGRRVIALLDGL